MTAETRKMNCITCHMGCEMTVTIENGVVTNVVGNTCP
ncbi:MAG: molybdopterin oxidoreductase, partial [Acholeplasmataceae bacterium]|nr:molybdopterin oxidoreductase [Acholeplasmataceae bacterium]